MDHLYGQTFKTGGAREWQGTRANLSIESGSGVEKKVSDHETIGRRKFFEFPENISPRKKKKIIVKMYYIKGESQRKILTYRKNVTSIVGMTSEMQFRDSECIHLNSV